MDNPVRDKIKKSVGIVVILLGTFALLVSPVILKSHTKKVVLDTQDKPEAIDQKRLLNRLAGLEQTVSGLSKALAEKEAQLHQINKGVVPAHAEVSSLQHASEQPVEDASEPQQSVRTAQSAVEYFIGANDVLFISVWQTPELDQEVVVTPDGEMSYPLIGSVHISGLTINQLKSEITHRLNDYMRQPLVTITLRKMGGKKVIVLGEVNTPGVYAVTGQKTLLEAIALAGGVTKDAVSRSVIVISGGLEKPHARRINLTRAWRGVGKENIVLNAEDVVYVPRKFIADLNYFLNQIVEPLSKGAYAADQVNYWSRIIK